MFEVFDDVLTLLRNLIASTRPLVATTPDINLSNKPLRDQRPQNPLQGLPGEVRPVHDPGRLPRPILDYPEDVQVDLQPRSSAYHEMSSDLPLTDIFLF